VRAALVVLVVAMAVPSTAEAGRSQYGWLYGSEVIPERGAEIQTWVAEKNGRFDTNVKETSMWWGAFVGVSDQLELAFPVEFLWLRADDPRGAATFTIEKFGVEARYRFAKADPDPATAPKFVPLVRVGLKRDVGLRDVTILEADLVASYQSGRFHGLIDAGVVAKVSRDDAELELRPGAGIAIEVKEGLRFGAEFYSELAVDDDLKKSRWAGVGPNMAWTHGRFWLSASFLIGLYQIDTAPRVVWGILF